MMVEGMLFDGVRWYMLVSLSGTGGLVDAGLVLIVVKERKKRKKERKTKS